MLQIKLGLKKCFLRNRCLTGCAPICVRNPNFNRRLKRWKPWPVSRGSSSSVFVRREASSVRRCPFQSLKLFIYLGGTLCPTVLMVYKIGDSVKLLVGYSSFQIGWAPITLSLKRQVGTIKLFIKLVFVLCGRTVSDRSRLSEQASL